MCFVFLVCGRVDAQTAQGDIRPKIGISEFEVSEKIDVGYGDILYDFFLTRIVSIGKVPVATPQEMPSASSRLPTCLLPVSDASFASLQGLSDGSLEAQEIQRQTVENPGYPLEVKTKGLGIHFRLVPAGTFMMGSPRSESGRHQDEGALHRVTISSHFYMSKYEITQGQWETVMGNNPSRFKDSGKNAPVENVNWDQCRDFCMMLSREEGASTQVFQLPTEAQWEYACRAGTTASSVGDIQFLGWYEGNSGDKTHPVGLKGANAWGLFDMYGNVYEWCRDWYQDRYSPEDAGDPTGPQNGNYRVLRGGSWFNGADYFRSANRGRYSPGNRREIIGFRVVVLIDDIK